MQFVVLDTSMYELFVITLIATVAAGTFLSIFSIIKGNIYAVPAVASLCLFASTIGVLYSTSPNAVVMSEGYIDGIGNVTITKPIRIELEHATNLVGFGLVLLSAMYLLSMVGIIPRFASHASSFTWIDFGALFASSIIYMVSLSMTAAIGLISSPSAIVFVGGCTTMLLVLVSIAIARRLGAYAARR